MWCLGPTPVIDERIRQKRIGTNRMVLVAQHSNEPITGRNGQATSHFLNQWWLVYRRIYGSLGLNELINQGSWRRMEAWNLVDTPSVSGLPYDECQIDYLYPWWRHQKENFSLY